MNLRTLPGAELVVLRLRQGGFAGWAGIDVATDPRHPEVFSQFVYPSFRGLGLGTLLGQVWWTHLDRRGCSRAYMRMELDSNRALYEKRLRSGYCRSVSAQELGPRFVAACGRCELLGRACRRQAFLCVDVPAALTVSARCNGRLDPGAWPSKIEIDVPHRPSAPKLP